MLPRNPGRTLGIVDNVGDGESLKGLETFFPGVGTASEFDS